MKLTNAQFREFCSDCVEKKCQYRLKYSQQEKCKYIKQDKEIRFWMQPIIITDEEDE